MSIATNINNRLTGATGHPALVPSSKEVEREEEDPKDRAGDNPVEGAVQSNGAEPEHNWRATFTLRGFIDIHPDVRAEDEQYRQEWSDRLE